MHRLHLMLCTAYIGDQALHVWGAKPPILGQGSRPKRPKPESRSWVLGKGQPAPSLPARESEGAL